ncbi:MAG: CRISPR-associated protein [Deltaproteobacteria bacterium]|nr:MAG: CRISPR-associated protein [Deltaproteobacteria bacterium]
MTPRFVLSTVGIGVFFNVLKPEEKSEWLGRINRVSNEQQLTGEVLEKVNELTKRASDLLQHGETEQRRRLSPELNGVYALCGDDLETDRDMHYLIATDTALGRAAAEMIRKFLWDQGGNVDYYIPPNLNTASFGAFSDGMKNLLTWCENTIPHYHESKYEVIFNLTASFKSLQGYLNVIGMFYADRLVYIFEGSSELLTIPRLPIQVDMELLQANADKLALLGAGAVLQRGEIPGMPEALLDTDESGNAMISEWGLLVWNRMKNEVLGKRLLSFPHFAYEPSFQEDFKNADHGLCIAMQETLAKAGVLLAESAGDTMILRKHSGLRYYNYTDQHTQDGPIGHFRIDRGNRISCVAGGKKLRLRHFGAHDYVNDNP